MPSKLWAATCRRTQSKKQWTRLAQGSRARAKKVSERESNMAKKAAKNTICLWYDQDAEAAARFYAETFPDSSVEGVHRAPSDYPSGKKGDVLTVDFIVAGFLVWASMAVPCSSTMRLSRSRLRPTIRKKQIATGTLSSATADRKASAAGARTNGASRGKLLHGF